VRLRWLAAARDDLHAIARYIRFSDPGAAVAWSGRIHAAARRAADHPHSGRRVPELDRDDVREMIVGRYRVLYRIVDDEVHIFALVHGSRQLPDVVDPGETDPE
jgi:plasmid stabilization system protein ParE